MLDNDTGAMPRCHAHGFQEETPKGLQSDEIPYTGALLIDPLSQNAELFMMQELTGVRILRICDIAEILAASKPDTIHDTDDLLQEKAEDK